LPFLERHSRAITVILVLIASARIVATYTVFNQTIDEPGHIACGMEWLDQHTYRYFPEQPPLARVAAALGPYLLGIRSQGSPRSDLGSVSAEGAAILDRGHHYFLTLSAARLGILPFFWIASFVVYAFAKRSHGTAVAAIAVFLFSFLPPVLAHSGLATTDMALTAYLGAAFLTALVWWERPTIKHAALFGAATGLAVFSKFSALVFFPAAVAVLLIGYAVLDRPRLHAVAGMLKDRLPSFAAAALTGAALIAAGYRFSLSALFTGIRMVMAHNAEGHPTYLLGRHSMTGFWYFYPVILAVKTPLAFLALFGLALVWALRRRDRLRHDWPALAFVAGILGTALFSHINIGVRHILPVYIGFSLLAAGAVAEMLERARTRTWARVVLGALLLWFAGSSLLCHPDYLAYCNELAGSQPERILADSDLDWGQDTKRLAQRLHELGARLVAYSPYSMTDFSDELGLPPIVPSNAVAPSPGWNAVSLSLWKTRRMGLINTHPEITPWPDLVPPGERIGKGIMLWYVRPNSAGGR